jgi:hypothetical protein
MKMTYEEKVKTGLIPSALDFALLAAVALVGLGANIAQCIKL